MDVYSDFLVIGAGIAGLSCARELQEKGLQGKVLDRSGLVGGRGATRFLKGDTRAIDFGPVFVHGDDPEFLDWAKSVSPDYLAGWPHRIRGTGTPCQPEAFSSGVQRFAIPGGMRTLSETLASGLDLHLNHEVATLDWTKSGLRVTCGNGVVFNTQNLVLATALEQSQELLQTGATTSQPLGALTISRAKGLLSQFSSLPSLTLMATYSEDNSLPDWDLWYPENSKAILLISNEGSKRPQIPGGPLLVIQARSSWSASRIDLPKDQWTAQLLDAAGELLGPWATKPLELHSHRWKYGRLNASQHLIKPLVFNTPGLNGQLGLTGDLFSPEGGLQGAWLAGKELTRQLLFSV